jgi:hypothetical protein
LQASIVDNLFHLCKLRLFVAFVHPDHDGRSVTKFVRQLHNGGWIITRTECSFPDYGNLVVGLTSVVIGVHTSTQSKVKPLLFKMPPTRRPLTLTSFIWPAFDKPDYMLSYAMTDESFNDATANGTIASMPMLAIMATLLARIEVLYHLHLRSTSPGSLNGSAVLSLDSLCPPFNGAPNTNLFHHLFGVEFHYLNRSYVQALLPFEFTSCFSFTDDLRYRLSQLDNWFALDAGIPAHTSAWIFDHVLDRLCHIRDSNAEIFEPNQYAAPAVHIQAFINGVVGTRLPDHEQWKHAYNSDEELSLIRDLIWNPDKLCNAILKNINYNYHSALRQGLIVIERDLLIYHEPILGGLSYTK